MFNFCSCYAQKIDFVITNLGNIQDAPYEIYPNALGRENDTTDTDMLMLEFLFVSDTASTLIVDLASFSEELIQKCKIRRGNNKLLNILKLNLNLLLNHISISMAIIENENNEMRFFSLLPYRNYARSKNSHIIDCNDESKRELNLNPNDSLYFPISFYKNDLRVKITDKKVRIHYLYKPTEEEKKRGFTAMVLTSNWFILDTKKMFEPFGREKLE
jgi:hypothetical protein